MDVGWWRKGDRWINLTMWEKEQLKPKQDTAQPPDQGPLSKSTQQIISVKDDLSGRILLSSQFEAVVYTWTARKRLKYLFILAAELSLQRSYQAIKGLNASMMHLPFASLLNLVQIFNACIRNNEFWGFLGGSVQGSLRNWAFKNILIHSGI